MIISSDRMSCQSNPLQQFVGKSDRVGTAGFGARFNSQEQFPPTRSIEHSFLNGQKNDEFLENKFLEVQQPSPVFPAESVSNVWLNQFSSMKLEDPLEFDNEYKKLYAGYQSQQTRRNVAHVSPALHRSIYQPVMRDPVANDVHFEQEFEALERELQDDKDELLDEESPLDYEFQKIASDIVNSTSNSPSPVSSKLSGSKFMGLMRDISGGLVSMRSNELRKSDGSVVGNEFTPVMDNMHKTNDFDVL